jgi:probable F420-dependent oxidoreductase
MAPCSAHPAWVRTGDRYDLGVTQQPFRFGLQVNGARSPASWAENAHRAEDLGFDSVLIGEHLLDGLFSPIVALSATADATSSLHVGTFVLNNDFRHPALLAREAATLDLLTDGRFELGIGAGHTPSEYREIGMVFDPAPVRVERLNESVTILRRLFDGENLTFTGRHYRTEEHRLFPARRPRLLVGGNGNQVLRTAATYADIIGFTGLGRTLADGHLHAPQWEWRQIDRKVALVRETAGERLADVEFNALVQHIAITDDRAAAVGPIAALTGTDPDVLLASPYLLVGSVSQVVEQLLHARDRWGFSYFVTRDATATAPVIDALR